MSFHGLSLFLLLLFLILDHTTCSEYHSIVERVVYKYPGKVEGDWDLPECGRSSVCSVMRLRFWQPPTIHRLCRCVQGSECPWKWANSTDQYHMPLDNRSQLKFCQKVSELSVCPPLQSGIVVAQRQDEESTMLMTEALCQCHWPAYWQLHRRYYRDYHNSTIISNNYFRCAQLTKCDRNQFCGHVVAETFSTYYRCSCPHGTMCLNRDRTVRNATELLHYGPTYRAYCLPVLHLDDDVP